MTIYETRRPGYSCPVSLPFLSRLKKYANFQHFNAHQLTSRSCQTQCRNHKKKYLFFFNCICVKLRIYMNSCMYTENTWIGFSTCKTTTDFLFSLALVIKKYYYVPCTTVPFWILQAPYAPQSVCECFRSYKSIP